MKKNAVALPFAVGAFLLFAGCGDDVTKTTNVNESTGILQLAKGDTLPECSGDNAGEMLYAADSGAVYHCTGKAWALLGGGASVDTVVIKDTLLQTDIRVISSVDTIIFRDTLVILQTDTLFGSDGKSCTAEMLADSSGYKIVCGGDSIGVVLNGAKGDTGEQGEKGEAGKNASCTLSDGGDGSVTVTCGETSTTLYKALCGSVPYDVSTFTCKNGDLYFTDKRDGQSYRAVVIGTQTWMAENLNYEYNEGTAMSYCYDNSADSCAKYGRLYTWSAAIDSIALANDGENPLTCGFGVECGLSGTVRGICPEGWHLPDTTEWDVLFTAAGGMETGGATITKKLFDEVAYNKLRATSGWEVMGDDVSGTDDFGFSVLPAGYEKQGGNRVGVGAYFWSATEESGKYGRYTAFLAEFSVPFGLLLWTDYGKDAALSVRCIKD